MRNPKRSLQQLQGSIGATAFELFVNRELKWIYRPVHQENDYGIDGYIDVVESNQVTGASLAVQIKCGNSYMKKKTPGGYRFDGEIRHLNYYCNLKIPVILVILDANGENGRWVQFGLEKIMPTGSPARWWIEIRSGNVLSSAVISNWKEIAGPVFDMKSALDEELRKHEFNALCTNMFVAIRKDGVLACDTAPLLSWQSKLLKSHEMMINKKASIEFWFEGWDDDPRELWQIPEVRSFFAKTMEEGFPWIYWLEAGSLWQGYHLLYACCCDVEIRVEGDLHYVEPSSGEALKEWMESCFVALNSFTDANSIPLEINKECSHNLFKFIKEKMMDVN